MAQAAQWWGQNRPQALGAVHDELDEAFALLRTQPMIGAVASNAHLQGVRRLHLSRIHYFLYYRVVSNRVDILALWHTSRGTSPSV